MFHRGKRDRLKSTRVIGCGKLDLNEILQAKAKRRTDNDNYSLLSPRQGSPNAASETLSSRSAFRVVVPQPEKSTILHRKHISPDKTSHVSLHRVVKPLIYLTGCSLSAGIT